MKGAIIGDIVGSVYEHANTDTKDFPLFRNDCFFTDDTVMTAAVAEALLDSVVSPSSVRVKKLTRSMQKWGRLYPNRGYGGRFSRWIYEDDPQPYNSWANGAPMRCSAAGWVAKSEKDASTLARQTCMPTHDHEESYKAAECTARLIWLARHGADMKQLETTASVYYDLSENPLDYDWVSSRNAMLKALNSFFESADFADAIRNAIAVGGDSDTIAAIAGSIAEAYYGVPDLIWESALPYLTSKITAVADRLYAYAEQVDEATD